MGKTEETLLTVPQAAQRLNVTCACIRRWCLERKIATVKLGRLIRVPYSEVERLVNSGFRPARPAR